MIGFTRNRLRRVLGEPERGSSALELALITPAMFALIFGFVQVGLYWHGQNVLRAVADEVGRQVRACKPVGNDQNLNCNLKADLPSSDELKGQALTALGSLDHGTVKPSTVGATAQDSAGNTVTVRITGRTVSILGRWQLPEIEAISRGSYEVFKIGDVE